MGKSELKGLVGNSPPTKAQDMGSIALLSPVRADGRLTNQLGAAKVSSALLAGHFPSILFAYLHYSHPHATILCYGLFGAL